MPDKKSPTNVFGQSLPLSEDQDYLGKFIQGTLGVIGLGDDGGKITTPSPLQSANRGGQVVGSVPTEVLSALKLGPMAAVAGVPPEYIARLRARSAELLQRIFESKQLEERSIGIAPLIDLKDRSKGFRTVPAPDELQDTLKFAQLRYPRLLSHNLGVADVDALASMGSTVYGASSKAGAAPEVRSSSLGDYIPAYPKKFIPTTEPGGYMYQKASDIPVISGKQGSFSNLGISSKSIEESKVNSSRGSVYEVQPGSIPYPQGKPYADVVGHELLHSADRLTMGDEKMSDMYKFANALPGGYNNNSQEIRARMQGAQFYKQYADWVAAGRPATKVKINKTRY